MLVQQVVNGLAMGCLYALIALGFTMIWNTVETVNFAQGEFSMIAMFVMLTVFVTMDGPFAVGLLLAILCTAAISILMGRVAIKPLIEKDPHVMVVATIGVSIILANGAKLIWGTQPFYFPSLVGTRPVSIGPFALSPQSLLVIGVTLVLVLALQLASQRTLVGKAMRAVAQDREMASLLGISDTRIRDITFGVSAALAAVAGVLMAPIVFVDAELGLPMLLRAFVAAVVGGFGSYAGALVGALFIGVMDNLTAFYLSSAYRDVISFGLLILVLALKPSGLLGKKGA